MDSPDLARCLALLEVADSILLAHDERTLAAHLSLVTELLREQVDAMAFPIFS